MSGKDWSEIIRNYAISISSIGIFVILFLAYQSYNHTLEDLDATIINVNKTIDDNKDTLLNIENSTTQLNSLMVKIAGSVDKTNIVLDNLNTATVSANKSLTLINDPDKGSIEIANKTLLVGKSTMTHADIFLNHEDSNLAKIDDQETHLYNSVNTTLGSVNSLLSDPYIYSTSKNVSGITEDVQIITKTMVAPSTGKKLSFLDRVSYFMKFLRGK
jgi:hypothetical protein